jgi:hypothetical protein
MVDRIDIERALIDIVSNEEGMRFQNLAVVLAKERWPELIACERHNDRGLDAYAPPPLNGDGIGKGLACSTTGGYGKLNRDAKTAKENYGDALSLLIFATLEKVTQDTEGDWREKIRGAHGLDLYVLSREDFITELQKPANIVLCRAHLKLDVPHETPVMELLGRAREAAATVAAEWAAHPRLAGQPQIMLDVLPRDLRGNESGVRFRTTEIRALLLQGRRLILEAPAGRGKTTTLIQLAQGATDVGGVPLLVDLPAWVRSRLEILDYVAQRPAFRSRGIGGADLARVATSEPLLFLLNGWNEVAEAHATDAMTALAELERTFPTSGIVVATRAHHVLPPLPGASRLELLPLTAQQRVQYLREALPIEQAQTLHATIIADGVLDDLTRTPLILAEITNLFRSGREIPRTKFGVLAAVISLTEDLEHHRAALQAAPLAGRAGAYLSAFALALTERGDVLLGEADARAICSTTSEQLRRAGQIAALPEPNALLATLTAHHLLERVSYPTTSFRFEHQQFQEYYAAVALRDTLVASLASNDPTQLRAFARTYLNVPVWEETLEMLAGALGATDEEIAISRVLVEETLLIDPVFAARLGRFSGVSVWAEIRAVLHDRLRSLYASPLVSDQECAIAAMLATGSSEFADIIVPRLTDPDSQVRLETYRAGPDMFPSSVGADWRTVVARWPEERRLEFMSHLTVRREQLDVASAFARTDPSARVRIEGIRLLAWMRQGDEVATLLDSLLDDEFLQAIEHTDLRELPPPLHTRALAIYAARLDATDDAKVRFQLALTLAEQGDPDGASRLKQELSNLPEPLVRELSNYSLRRGIDIVRRADAGWVSEWVAYRIVEGALWQDTWLPLLSEIPQALRDEWFQRAVTEETQQGGVVGILAKAADAPLARRAFEALRDQRHALRADPQNEREQTLERRLTALVRAIPAHMLVDGLAPVLAADPVDEDLDVFISIFGESHYGDQPTASLSDPTRAQLRRYLKAAVGTVLAREDFRGEAKARLATALGDIGNGEDMDDLLALLRADIERVRTGRQLLRDGRRIPQSNGATMSWSHYHVQAIVRLDPRGAAPILCDLLSEAEYERDAAWGLRELAKKELSAKPTIQERFFGGSTPDYRTIRQTPRLWEVLYDPDRRLQYARAIHDRIAQLLEERQRDPATTRANEWRAKELARPLAALDPHDSADALLEIAALPLGIDGGTPVGLIEALVFGGVTPSADRALALIEPVVERLRAHGTYNDNAGLVRHLACVLPFVDPPARGLTRVRELLAEFPLAAHEQRELLPALAQCFDEDGLRLLCEIARQDGDQFQYVAREWLGAIAASPHARARQLLLGFVDHDVVDGVGDLALPEDALGVLAAALADFARADRAARERLLDLCSVADSPQARTILAKVCAQLGTTEALFAALKLIDDDAVPPIPYDLFETMEGLFLEKRPSSMITNAYSLIPRAGTDVRARLFELATSDQRRRTAASHLLRRIEAWRLEHGRPAAEPRHPAFDSGTLWPLPVTTADTHVQ